MTYTKSNGILKRLGALVMALGLTCALAVTASALEVDATYEASLEATVVFPPHDLDFFASDAFVEDNGDGTQTVTIALLEDAKVTVFGQTVTGNITGASTETEGYTAAVEDGVLIVTCPETVTADQFAPVLDFKVELDNYGEEHEDVSAVLYLSEVVAE